MALSAEDRRLYVRQILLPEIGIRGQEKLCGAVFTPGTNAADQVAAEYLLRAGFIEENCNDTNAIEWTPVQAALRGAFAAVEEMKSVLGVGTPGTFPDALFAEDAEEA